LTDGDTSVSEKGVFSMKSLSAAAVLAVSLLVVAAPVIAAPHHATTTRTPTLEVKSSRYGKILFDGAGRALYSFARDRAGGSVCSAACAKAWPPLLTAAKPHVVTGGDPMLLGTIKRADGTLQVTYHGHPLYYFFKDTKPGQITCQNVSNFGGLWLVVAKSGTPVK
jgi:predicted lipoprotein with Yx(FWY)xxD motif